MIAFSCCRCGMKFNVKDEYAGRSTKCPTCKLALTVPLSDRTVAHVPEGQIDGTASSLAQAGVDGGVTVDQEVASPGQKSVSELLVRQSKKGQRYIIDKEIARGGMGAVLRAVDCDIRREVAVKYMLGETEPKQKLRFIEEAQITGQLEHPNIVPIHELGVDARKRVFFSMKMVKGRSLGQVLDELRQNPKKTDYSLIRLLNILVNVCNGLAYAHSRGVVHRDLKPANIMVGDFGEVYVMDWGLAKVLKGNGKATPMAMAVSGPPSAIASSSSKVATSREPDADLTQEGAILGTPVYMPPEQANGHVDAIDQRSDIYSLGAILYEMLTLQAPIEKEGGYLAILMRVTLGEIALPEKRNPKRAIPRELSAIAMKALAKIPGERYSTVEALRKDIERFQEGRSVSAKEDTKREMLWKFVKRNKAFSATASVAAVLIAVILFYSFTYNYQARVDAVTAKTKAEENYAAYRQEQETRRDQAAKAVPAFLKAARLSVQRLELDDALIHLNLALTHAPDRADARLLRAQVLLGRQEFAAARAELERYLTQAPRDTDSARLAQLSAAARPGDAATETLLADVLFKQDQPALAGILNRSKEKAKLLPIYQKQIESTWPGLGGCLSLDKDSKLILDFRDSPVVDLAALKGMQLSSLNLSRTRVKDLTPLQGMPLTTLNLLLCGQISDLTPLQGMPLTTLTLDRSVKVSDLTPLKGMRLTALDLYHCDKVSDLTPLQGMPLTMLTLDGCDKVSDLTPLQGMPLTTLTLVGCVKVSDLTPLKGMPLTTLDLYNCGKVSDLTPLQGMPLTALNLGGCVKVSDLTPLKGMPLATLNLDSCGKVSDLAPLKGMRLTALDLGSCGKVLDLAPLKGVPLTTVNLAGCDKVSDLTPLAGMKLGYVHLPPKVARGMAELRKMETLKTINDKLAADFWKDYDAGKYKGTYDL